MKLVEFIEFVSGEDPSSHKFLIESYVSAMIEEGDPTDEEKELRLEACLDEINAIAAGGIVGAPAAPLGLGKKKKGS